MNFEIMKIDSFYSKKTGRAVADIILYFILLCTLYNSGLAQTSPEITIEGEFKVHASNIARFNAPLSSKNGSIYVAYISPDLQTVVAQKRNGQWHSTVVSEITQVNPYHNAPSIGIDEAGFVHVGYNMHATPWQYQMSRFPHDISEGQFRGQYAGETQGHYTPGDSQCEGDCFDNWLGNGLADIPGNQIGYMFMANDRDGKLYVAFRECNFCGNSYHQRQRSGGIAVYDAGTRKWRRLGGARPWATDSIYSTLGLHFHFDRNNRMHGSWVWGRHYTPDQSSDAFWFNPHFPCYAYSDEGGETFFTAQGQPLS